MRTTLNIDDDLLAAAKSLARAQSQSLSTAVSDLIRRGLRQESIRYPDPSGEVIPAFHVRENARPITLEDVQRAEDVA